MTISVGRLSFLAFVAGLSLLGCKKNAPPKSCTDGAKEQGLCLIPEFQSYFELPICLGESLDTIKRDVARLHFDKSTKAYHAELEKQGGYFGIELVFQEGCLKDVEVGFGGHGVMTDSAVQYQADRITGILERFPGYLQMGDTGRVQIAGLRYEMVVSRRPESIIPLVGLLRVTQAP